MKVELLAADVRDLEEFGTRVSDSFDRGCAAIGDRRTHARIEERPHTDEGLAELVDLFAERSADLRLVRFSYATKKAQYARSTQSYDDIEEYLRLVRRDVAPALRARLRELRAREAELEHALAERGIDARAVGPLVPDGSAVDPTPKPGEGPAQRVRLAPLPPKRSLLWRLLRLIRPHLGLESPSLRDRARG